LRLHAEYSYLVTGKVYNLVYSAFTRIPFKMPFLVILEGIYAQNVDAIVLNEGTIAKYETIIPISDFADIKFDIADIKNGYIIYTVLTTV